MKKPIEILKDWYNVKTTHGLWLNIIKDIVFYSIFFYLVFNANQYCAKLGLPTVEQYKHCNYTVSLNISNFTLPQK